MSESYDLELLPRSEEVRHRPIKHIEHYLVQARKAKPARVKQIGIRGPTLVVSSIIALRVGLGEPFSMLFSTVLHSFAVHSVTLNLGVGVR